MISWLGRGTQRDSAVGTCGRLRNVIVHIPLTVQHQPCFAGARERFPLIAVSQAMLQPTMLYRPASRQKVEIVLQ